MSNISINKFFHENGNNHEQCNLTDLVFKDLDYETIGSQISFFRSDFSRSRFYNCNFYNNLFGRADFIDVHIKNTDFCCVDFGSCLFKNALLEKATFKKNNYRGVAIQYSCFKNCVFREEQFITNMYNCEFYECTFIGCSFKKSSLDCNTFTNCEFIKVDMSECIAENLRFDSCALRDVYLCANLWTTYLYKNTDIFNFGFKYRGEITDIWNGNANEFVAQLINKQLYFEYLNSIIIGNQIPKEGLVSEIKRIFPLILGQSEIIRKRSLIKFFDMLLFYRNCSRISFYDYVKIYEFLSEYAWDNLPFNETLIYQAELYKIKKTIDNLEFDLSYMRSIPTNAISVSVFHIDSNEESDAIAYLEHVFERANSIFCQNAFEKPLIYVLKQEKGSVVLTIASAAILALFVSYVAKRVMHNINSICIEFGIKKQLLKDIKNSDDNISKLRKNCELAKKYGFLSESDDIKQIESLSSEIAKGEILDIILKFLF